MKNRLTFSILVFLMLIINSKTFSQSGKVPPFRMIQANGKIFKAENLPIGKPIVIIYFSPDCEDCQRLTKELLARINDFKGVSFAMVTYQPVENVSKYVTKNSLGKYDNIYVGTEGSSLFVKNYYNIMHFPFVALYNKNGDLIVKYNTKEVDLDNLLYRIRNL
jgi:thiol-disulfide isomerase/thioredoxin